MSDDEGDPFEELEKDVEGREGDPFEKLAAEGDEETTDSDEGDRETDPLADAAGGDDTAEQSGTEDTRASTETSSPAQEPSDAPSERAGPVDAETADTTASTPDATESDGQSADEIATGEPSGMEFGVGRDAAGSPDVATDAFEDVGQREGDPFEGANSAFEEMDVESIDPDKVWEGLESAEARGSVGEASKRTYAEVSKHSFCEQCEHFSEPPDIACAHEGTEIVEFLDMETVRVVDCPIVAERRELEQEE